MKLLDKINYIPVLNGGILSSALNDDWIIDGKRISFFTKDGLYKYNKFLINPFHNDSIFEEILKRDLIPKDSVVQTDSVTRNQTIIIKINNEVKRVYIGDFIDELLTKEKNISKSGHEFLDIKDYEVLTVDNNGKKCFRKLKQIIRHKVNKDIYRVLSYHGTMIEITEDHSLIDLDKNKTFYKRKIINYKKNEDYMLSIDNYNQIFENKQKKYMLFKTNNQTINFNLNKQNLMFLGYYVGDGTGTNNNRKYGGISISGAHNKEVKVLFKNFCKQFTTNKIRFNGKYDICVSDRELFNILRQVGVTKLCHEKNVPDFIFNLSKEQIGWFLNGYFSADGACYNNIVGCATCSRKLFEDICILLKILDIHHSITYEYYSNTCKFKGKTYKRLPMYVIKLWKFESFKKYNKYIKFFIKYKQDELEKLLYKCTDNTSSTYKNIPVKYLTNDEYFKIKKLNGGIYRSMCKRKIEKYLGKENFYFNNDLIFQRIKSINKINYDDYVYDIEVEDTHRFICSNILAHNSGGLQGITLGETQLNPVDVFKWQQEHSSIGFSMDSLPYITKQEGTNKPGSFGGWIFDTKNFLNHARKSKENIDVTKKYRDYKKEFYFYGIVQGRTYYEELQWYEILRDEYLDGYCVKASNNNPLTLAETCIFAINNINKPIHFLGTGNISRSIIPIYASKYFKQPISFDSSSYDIGTQYRAYVIPFNFNKKIRFVSEHNITDDIDKKDILHIDDVSKICECIACKCMKNAREMIDNNDGKLGPLISLHNFILYNNLNNFVVELLKNEEKLREFVVINFEPSLATKILSAFDMIDVSMEKGFEYAFNKYKEDMIVNKEVSNQKSIFGF